MGKSWEVDFGSKPVYGDDNKYIKTKKKDKQAVWLQIFIIKKYLQRKHHVSVY